MQHLDQKHLEASGSVLIGLPLHRHARAAQNRAQRVLGPRPMHSECSDDALLIGIVVTVTTQRPRRYLEQSSRTCVRLTGWLGSKEWDASP
jgi:hypothetical protein